MSVTLKKDSWKIKDGNGTYRDSAIFSTTLPEDAAAIVAEATSAIDAQQIRATDIVDTATDEIDTIVQRVNDLVDTGTDTTLTQAGAAADAKAAGDKIGELRSAKSDLNALQGVIEYWGDPEELSINNTYYVRRIGVKRDGAYVTLTGKSCASDGANPYDVAVKLLGSLDRASSNDSKSWPADLALKAGHTYIFSIRVISGTWSLLGSATNPNISFRVRDSSNAYTVTSGAIVTSPQISYASEKVTVESDTNVKLDLFIRGGIAITSEAKFYVDIQDITDALAKNEVLDYLDDRIDSVETSLGAVDDRVEAIENASPKSYTLTEADRVAEKVRNVQTGTSLTFMAISDLHYNVDDATTQKALDDMRQGVKAIAKQLHIDCYVCFGDIIYRLSGATDFTKGKQEIIAATKIINDAFGNNKQLRLVGNHDPDTSNNDGYYLTQEYLNSIFGAYSEDLIKDPDRPYGSYGYIDFETQKVRLIVINTSFYGKDTVPTGNQTQYLISGPQALHIAQTLDISSKEDAAEWQIVVFSHVPIDVTGSSTRKLAQYSAIFDAYQKGERWYTTSQYNYNFAGKNAAKLAVYVNGHAHRYRVKNLDNVNSDGQFVNTLEMAQIYVPNALPDRDQESVDGVTYTKTANTAESTAFQVITMDFENKVVYAHHFGAGIDFIVHYEPTAATEFTSQLTSPSWSTYDTNIATVSSGIVTPVDSGNVMIFAKSTTDNCIECWNYKSVV